MKTWGFSCATALFAIACIAANNSPAGNHSTSDYANSPVSFEANIGQVDPAVEFLAHGNNRNLLLTRNEAWLTLQNNGRENAPRVLGLKLSGANSHPKLEGLNPLPGNANYFYGQDSSRWRTDVPTFSPRLSITTFIREWI
ncbi:MAG TPA: hypothetical protein VIK53_14800 [Verrucomicrobiae bacterium]